jgi:hypothetical protein
MAKKPSRTKIIEMVDAFLAEQRKSYGGGWAQVTDSDEEDLRDIVDALIRRKCQPDADGDRPFEFELVNRRKNERMRFVQMPYSRLEDLEDCFEKRLEISAMNLRLAFRDWDSVEMERQRWIERDRAQQQQGANK